MGISKKTITSFINGDMSSAALVFEEYKNLLYFIIATYVANPDDCDDILSETFIKAIESKGNIKNTDNIKSYLTSIAKNEALQFLRNNRAVVTDKIDDIPDLDKDSNVVLDYLEPTLSNKETVVVYYRAVFSYTWKQIKDITGIPETSLKRIYKNGKEKLRKEFL